MLSKYICFTIVGIFWCSYFCSAQIYKNDLEERNLKGAVEKIEKKCYRVKDEFGKIIKIDDDTGSGVEMWSGYYVGGVSGIEFYNRNGFEIKSYIGRGTGKYEFTNLRLSKFDDHGRLIERADYIGMTGELHRRIMYYYNDIGLLVGKDDITKVFPFRTLYQYDVKNQLKKETYESGETKKEFFYDEIGNLVKVVEDSGWKTIQYRRDRNGKLLEKIFYEDNKWNHTIQYNDNGDIREVRDKESRVEYYEYKYDIHGNWIEQRFYEGELRVIKGVSERRIFYYDNKVS